MLLRSLIAPAQALARQGSVKSSVCLRIIRQEPQNDRKVPAHLQISLPFQASGNSSITPVWQFRLMTTTTNASVATQSPPGVAEPGIRKSPKKTDRMIVFVLGGPGSGKGTQCAKLVEEFGIVHLSAGDLLRAHMKSGTADGNMVAEMIKQGTIVPSHVTNSLLEKAMDESQKNEFLIDGFPRNEENRSSFEKQTGEEPHFILFFDCPEQVMEQRLLGRSEGRTDDNIETIRKRFKVFKESSIPVVEHYRSRGKVYTIDSTRSPADVYSEVRRLFLDR